ncbi:MAG: phenylalanine--tRNA ligase subunit beta [Candidatus Woykebacteria bacterium GWB1_45_5]|uniref:Phenylalanine--tRNA ligase beta subunit n=2 Tax=Candidatus Woykeibacteriota TaxID=1817899 RepID=A0A1G1W3J4_9BACT|nr:MAG: phenylalanine--tRNA ligase subunit beta [Candidatus Woykebacteria bacterium GWA1_44_8]OGY24476.1 MAG: phenylalanine--tRNA ligase subunit beta [Candidatus Woykebacteria bacterium GWB1_45_5]
MKLPLSWLCEFIEIKEEPEKLAEDLLYSGTKVEAIEKIGGDTIFDFEITPNRADCLSVIGIAREIAAIYRRVLRLPPAFTEIPKLSMSKGRFVLEVIDEKLCPYYSLGIIDSVKVAPSPGWLANRLEKSGIRSINNIVDITNYVMLETGQPMHAFDYNKVKEKMVLRASKEGEIITTLDNIERKLPAGAIIIEDSERIIDLAGLMGGKVSEVDQNTKTVILHAPLYDPLTIRRTSQALGLRTEASNRFEKQLDPSGHRFAFERAAELFRTITQGQLVSRIKSVGYPPVERKFEAPISLFKKVLGISLTPKEICEYLSRLEFAFALGNEAISVTIPSFRTDINSPIDLTEEVGRLFGYNKFPKTLPTGQPPTVSLQIADFDQEIKQVFVSLGLKEIYSNTLTSASVLENIEIKSEVCLKVANRLIIDHEYLRPTLLVGLLLAAKSNMASHHSFSLFEVGKVFEKHETKNGLPNQPKKVAALLVNSNFSFAKGVVEAVLRKLNIYKESSFSKAEKVASFGEGVANVFVKGNFVGVVGDISTNVLARFDTPAPTFAFELDLETLKSLATETSYQPAPKFPTARENISLFLPNKTNFAAVLEAVKEGAGKNYYQAELLEDTIIGTRRSILIGIEYYDSAHTLKKEEVDTIRKKVLAALEKIGAEPRIKGV